MRLGCNIAAFLITLSTCLLYVQVGQAQRLSPNKSITQYGIVNWGVDKGLQSASVLDIAQTVDGFLWLATFDGVVRFDGHRFKTYNKQNTPAFLTNGVQCLTQDHSGTMWMGLKGGGLIKYENGKFRTNASETLATETIFSIYEDFNEEMWFGTFSDVFKTDKEEGTITKVGHEIGINSEVRAFARDEEGRLWIGSTQNGLVAVDKDSLGKLRGTPYMQDHNITALHYMPYNGQLWIGTDKGLYTIKTVKDTNPRPFLYNGEPISSVTCIHEDQNRTLWIGTEKGIYRLRPNRTDYIGKKTGLADDYVRSLFTDNEGNLWMGTDIAGLIQIKDGKFLTFGTQNGLLDDIVHATSQDLEGRVWVGTQSGVSVLDPHLRTATNIDLSKFFKNLQIRDIYCHNDGRVWIASYGDGLLEMKAGAKPILYNATNSGLKECSVRRLLYTPDGKLYMGTKRGLFVLEEGVIQKVDLSQAKSSEYVMDLRYSPRYGIIVSTNNGGVVIIKNNEIKTIKEEDGLAGSVVYCAFEDSEGVLWFGTNNGLTRLQNANAAQINATKGLPDDIIFQIAEDMAGNLWMTCKRGIFTIKKSDVVKLAVNRLDNVKCRLYDHNDGLRSTEITANGKITKLNDGRLAFATLKGLAFIHPDSIPTNYNPPQVFINSLFLDGEEIEVNRRKRMEVNDGFGRLTIEFSALSFAAPSKVKFRYKLEPVEREWVEIENLRHIDFTGLSGGEYVFKLQACNNDQIWNEAGNSLVIYIKPVFYKAFWFRGLVVMLLGFLIFFIWLYGYKVAVFKVKRSLINAKWYIKEQQDEA
ncbi:MAG: hypothetical protein EAZ57_05270 [Cytophagales bacterium]|nr:MAG: hypothetical protein EAZ67_06310 [Cytophagales bacterium]TAF60960.1 MAG: hypothetical protein EAZ57_05270 [Cytophagales bacterium]